MRRALLYGLLLLPALAQADDRETVITRARAFAYHPWHCGQQNMRADCSDAYQSSFEVGDHVGLPYDWGGYMSLHNFDRGISNGAGAGSYPGDGILDCTVGLDCSGYVSRCWGVGHYTTRSIPDISDPIDVAEVERGDVFNTEGYHVVLFSHRQPNGLPFLFESIGYGVHPSFDGGWAQVDGYIPRRHERISEGLPRDPLGTAERPIEIEAFPFNHEGDTSRSPSRVLDHYSAAPETREWGPEVVYHLRLDRPGLINVTVQDEVGVDIDVHLLSAFAGGNCLARGHHGLEMEVGCGEYFIVADSWTNEDRVEFAGAYELSVDFSPGGGPCVLDEPYDIEGRPGEPCSFPDNRDLPDCNINTGAEECLHDDEGSFCSMRCEDDSNCRRISGGCCAEINRGERYCLPEDRCHVEQPVDAGLLIDAAPPIDAGLPEDAAPPVDLASVEDQAPLSDQEPPLDEGSAQDQALIQDAVPQPDPDAASQPDPDAAPQPESDAAPQPDPDATPQPDPDAGRSDLPALQDSAPNSPTFDMFPAVNPPLHDGAILSPDLELQLIEGEEKEEAEGCSQGRSQRSLPLLLLPLLMLLRRRE